MSLCSLGIGAQCMCYCHPSTNYIQTTNPCCKCRSFGFYMPPDPYNSEDEIKSIKHSLDAHADTQKDVFLTLARLEKQIESLTEMYKSLSIDHAKLMDNDLNRKYPYKCPTCGGEGKNKNKLVIDNIVEPNICSMKNPDCLACKGTGIIWG